MVRFETLAEDGLNLDVSSGKRMDWAKLLKESRNIPTGSSNESYEDLLEKFGASLPCMKSLFQEYNDGLQRPHNLSKEKKKQVILDTRSALRLTLSASSLKTDEFRKQASIAFLENECHHLLCRLLESSRGDAKCRSLASQLLSNLATSHCRAAEMIANSINMSPSKDSIAERIRRGILQPQDDGLTNNDNNDVDFCGFGEKPNWVDMLLACAHAGNRQAVSGIVAALHNLIVSLQSSKVVSLGKSTTADFAEMVASSDILVSTLLRQIISVQSVKHAFDHRRQSSNVPEEATINSDDDSLGDSTTEWIAILLLKCCQLGLLPNLISSAGGCKSHTSTLDISVVPEHIILLQCVQSEVESSILNKANEYRNVNLLGGEGGSQTVESTHVFLAKLFASLRISLGIGSIANTCTEDPDAVLQRTAMVIIIELLSASLCRDNPDLALARAALGARSNCTVIQDSLEELGYLVDTLTARNSGQRSRHFFVSGVEQRAVTALVRFIGNVCHRCRQNQDLVRSTKIPLPVQLLSAGSEQALGEERNGLHIILTCTSLAHACFTLREWSVVAIQHLLDGNESNQLVVAKLEADRPVQTEVLGELGIQIEMDPKGNVSVIPEDKAI